MRTWRSWGEVSTPSVEVTSKGYSPTSRPEFEFRPSGRFMDTQRVYRGPAGFVDFWGAFQVAWEEITVSIERMEDLDDRVLTLGTFHGRGGGSGVEVNAEAAWLHTIKDGLIVHLRSFSTWKEALEAAGLRE